MLQHHLTPPRRVGGTAEPNLTYGTAAAKPPAGKVVLGRGAVRQSRATLLSPPVFPRAGPSHQGIKRRIWCKTGCRGERVPGVQGRAGAPATGSANPNRTYLKGGRLGAPLPPPGHPSHAPLASSPIYSPRQEQSTCYTLCTVEAPSSNPGMVKRRGELCDGAEHRHERATRPESAPRGPPGGPEANRLVHPRWCASDDLSICH